MIRREIRHCSCGNICEGTTDRCASCGALERKAARVKPSNGVTAINRLSEKGSKVNQRYLNRLRTWKKGKKCAATFPHECSTEIECHHVFGRSNDSFHDEYAMENNIVLTLDERFWMPLCEDAHRYITEHSAFAWANGYSYKRVSDPIFQRKEA